ncbi:unnamed protein product [Hymenolepis diminuta]|uniref:Uncharacterized protein n=1 Tax=Hymenolepis diminuta TaxID=6216 RepID=A0A564XUT8_HYMDI|nr:unnamed protein product [Hymenolepis diminuta]
MTSKGFIIIPESLFRIAFFESRRRQSSLSLHIQSCVSDIPNSGTFAKAINRDQSWSNAGNSSGSSSKTDSTDALWGRRSHVGPQSVHAIANARAQHMLSGLGDLDPEQPSTMPSLLQLHRDINELFKPIKIPELK